MKLVSEESIWTFIIFERKKKEKKEISYLWIFLMDIFSKETEIRIKSGGD